MYPSVISVMTVILISGHFPPQTASSRALFPPRLHFRWFSISGHSADRLYGAGAYVAMAYMATFPCIHDSLCDKCGHPHDHARQLDNMYSCVAVWPVASAGKLARTYTTPYRIIPYRTTVPHRTITPYRTTATLSQAVTLHCTTVS